METKPIRMQLLLSPQLRAAMEREKRRTGLKYVEIVRRALMQALKIKEREL